MGGRPSRLPARLARSRPSAVRSAIRDRSNSASPPRTVRMSLPVGVVVSAHESVSAFSFAPLVSMVWTISRRSRVDRASRSSRVMTSTSPSVRVSRAFFSSGRSDRAPLIVSLNTEPHPAALSCSSCASRVWPEVETRAYPIEFMP